MYSSESIADCRARGDPGRLFESARVVAICSVKYIIYNMHSESLARGSLRSKTKEMVE
jgi:hypothetical protein